jgi:hypothetical protein
MVLSKDDQISRILVECSLYTFVSLPSLIQGNSIVSWAYTYTQVHNVSQCWVCTELPTGVFPVKMQVDSHGGYTQ